MPRNEPAENGNTTAASNEPGAHDNATTTPSPSNNPVENELVIDSASENTLNSILSGALSGASTNAPDITPGTNTSQEIEDFMEAMQSQQNDVINQFMAQFAVEQPQKIIEWPKNVSVFASSRYDQTSGTNSGERSRTGVYTDALLKSAGVSSGRTSMSDLFAAMVVHSMQSAHELAQSSLKDSAGIFAVFNLGNVQTPQASPGANPLHFRDKLSTDNHAVFLSGFDSRHGMHLGFKDDMDNMHRLTRKLGIPDRNVGEFSNVKSAVLEAYLKDYKGKTGDRFVIYYSGHGSSELSEKGRDVAEKNLMKQDKLSARQAQNVIDFIEGKGGGAAFVKMAKASESLVMEIVKQRFPEYYEEMMKGLEKESGLTRPELQSALGLLRNSSGFSSTAIRTSVFQDLGANDPKHYDGILHSKDAITESDLKRMTAEYLSGFKNVVIISDSCYAGALIADSGLAPDGVGEESPERQAA